MSNEACRRSTSFDWDGSGGLRHMGTAGTLSSAGLVKMILPSRIANPQRPGMMSDSSSLLSDDDPLLRLSNETVGVKACPTYAYLVVNGDRDVLRDGK